jgi:hypothetical protein
MRKDFQGCSCDLFQSIVSDLVGWPEENIEKPQRRWPMSELGSERRNSTDIGLEFYPYNSARSWHVSSSFCCGNRDLLSEYSRRVANYVTGISFHQVDGSILARSE